MDHHRLTSAGGSGPHVGTLDSEAASLALDQRRRASSSVVTPSRSSASTPHNPGQDQIAVILERLARVEQHLDALKPRRYGGEGAADLAEMRSLLAPAMHRNAKGHDEHPDAESSAETSIYSHHQAQGDALHSLSLRRDLSRPENPPFGAWWTYTVEETLLWPILEYRGSVNSSLDVILEDSGEDSDQDACQLRDERPLSIPKKRKLFNNVSSGRNGLDDGAVVPELVENFLRNVHVKFPILEPHELRARAANLIENGLEWDGETCQVLLACALGAISCPWRVPGLRDYSCRRLTSDRYSIARDYFSAGQRRLGPLCARSSLIAGQCMFLAGTFLMYLHRPVGGWRLLNMASITCRSYISKRIACEARGKPLKDSHSMEQRLCWSCFKAEREVAVEFGMETSGLNMIAYSTSLPTPPNGYARDTDSTLPSSATSLEMIAPFTLPRESYEDQSWFFFLTEIMLRKLEMRIDNFFQAKRREAYRLASTPPEVFFSSLVEVLQEFRYQLSSYYESLPATMQFPLDDPTPCQDELLHYLRWRFYSAKHDICLPALYILIHNDIAGWSSNIVDKLILLANECLELDMIFMKTTVTTHRQHDTWLVLRKSVRSALILIAARRLKLQHRPGLEKLQTLDDQTCREGASMLVKGLEYWSEESRDCATYLTILRSLHPDFQI